MSASASPETGSSLLKRLSCGFCRRRKLRCKRQCPRCESCRKRGLTCVYEAPKVRKVVPPGYAVGLEQRLGPQAQGKKLYRTLPDVVLTNVEKRLGNSSAGAAQGECLECLCDLMMHMNDLPWVLDRTCTWTLLTTIAIRCESGTPLVCNLGELMRFNLDSEQLYFENIHSALSTIHKRRYYDSLNGTGRSQIICLRYIVCALGACISEEDSSVHERLYALARQQVENLEMQDLSSYMPSIARAQAWTLAANYEFYNLHLQRAWTTTGRAVRLIQRMKLHQMDQQNATLTSDPSKSRDWTAVEERRRAFWAVFCLDRQAGIGMTLPMSIDEQDVSCPIPIRYTPKTLRHSQC